MASLWYDRGWPVLAKRYRARFMTCLACESAAVEGARHERHHGVQRRSSNAFDTGWPRRKDRGPLNSELRMYKISEDLFRALERANLVDYFDGCTDSHRRQYQEWIDEAKKPETRQKRISEAAKMIGDKARAEGGRGA